MALDVTYRIQIPHKPGQLARVDEPRALVPLGRWQAESLKRQGADPGLGARLAEIRGELDHAARWQSAADEIQQDILEHGVDERGVFLQLDAPAQARPGEAFPMKVRTDKPSTVVVFAVAEGILREDF